MDVSRTLNGVDRTAGFRRKGLAFFDLRELPEPNTRNTVLSDLVQAKRTMMES